MNDAIFNLRQRYLRFTSNSVTVEAEHLDAKYKELLIVRFADFRLPPTVAQQLPTWLSVLMIPTMLSLEINVRKSICKSD